MSILSTTPSIGQTKPACQSPNRAKIVLAAVQMVLVCGIGLAGSQALFSMLNPLPDASQGAELQKAAALPPMPVTLPAEGTWTLGNSPLSLGVEIVASNGLAARIARPPQPEAIGEAAHGSVGDTFLKSLRSICTVSEARDGSTVYSLDQPRLKLRLFSRGTGRDEPMLGGYLAYPRGPESWTLVVGTPCVTAAAGAGRLHLLPLTTATQSIGTRMSTNGRLQCEVLHVQGSWEELCRTWQVAGWSVSRAAQVMGENVFCCTRNGAQVRVHVYRQGAERQAILLVIDVDALLDLGNSNPHTERASS